MPLVIAEPGVGTCKRSCVAACPVNCIQPSAGYLHGNAGKQLYINPKECIGCGACQWECPVEAIFPARDLPIHWRQYAEINANYFKNVSVNARK